jgi:hypothetical protein
MSGLQSALAGLRLEERAMPSLAELASCTPCNVRITMLQRSAVRAERGRSSGGSEAAAHVECSFCCASAEPGQPCRSTV